jgi:protein-S-isoprenylcysteine O-methyltransferase Ste14
MLCLLLGTGLLITPLPVLLLSVVPFMIGTEIRVRVEDALLAANLGESFQEYKHGVPACITLLK